MEPKLTLDDLERLAFVYGGTLMRDLSNDTYLLVGAVMAGRRVTLGPVPNPVTVKAVA